MLTINTSDNNGYYPQLVTDIKRVNGKIEVTDKIKLIKAIRDLTFSSLVDAKDFTDDFLRRINKIQPDIARIKDQAKARIDNISDPDSLQQILDAIERHR